MCPRSWSAPGRRLFAGLRRQRRWKAVLDAMARVPRELFVPEESRHQSYEDIPLPIGGGQTISQPYIVALMTHALDIRPRDRVLELGTGSGYQAAILSLLARRVYSVERVASLAKGASALLRSLGYSNVEVHRGGQRAWPARAGPLRRHRGHGRGPKASPIVDGTAGGGRPPGDPGRFAERAVAHEGDPKEGRIRHQQLGIVPLRAPPWQGRLVIAALERPPTPERPPDAPWRATWSGPAPERAVYAEPLSTARLGDLQVAPHVPGRNAAVRAPRPSDLPHLLLRRQRL